MDCHKLFYYSCDANKEDINYIASFQSEKFILINPFKNLKFDDNCSGKINPINSSAYSELGNAFGGIDV